MDSDEIAMVVLTGGRSAKTLVDLVEGATNTLTRSSCQAGELREVLNSETYAGLLATLDNYPEVRAAWPTEGFVRCPGSVIASYRRRRSRRISRRQTWKRS